MKTRKLLSLILSVIMIIGTVQVTTLTAGASTDAFDGEWVTIGTGSDSDDTEFGDGTESGGTEGGETGSGESSGTEGDGTAVSYLVPVYENGEIAFDEYNDVVFETKTVMDYIVAEDIAYGDTITSADQMPTIGTSGETTWYVADSDVEWENFVLVQGDVHLIICDDVSITSLYGIVVSEGNSFTVYGQENGTGTLVAKGVNYSGGFYSAAIGGCDVTTEMANGGTITINGGIISVSASPNAAAIGGSKRGTGGTITINGGSVDAKGAAYSAAIGGGSGGNSGNITINGGIVSAETSGSSSAIGAGYVMYSSTGESILAKTDKIEINGGTVVATHTDSYEEYPVIGGLYGFDNINISGGHITVNHARSVGIGIGTNSVTVMEFDGNLNISGGTIISGNDKTLYLGAGKTSSSAKGTVDVIVTGGNISGTFKNVSTLTDGKNDVEMKEITIDGAEDQTEVTVLEDYPTYGLCDVVTDGDKVVIYVPVSETYTVTVSDSFMYGTVQADVSEASEGDTVTLTITPDKGYILKSVSAIDAEGNDVPITDNTFTMPASDVTVSAEFEYENTIYNIVGSFDDWTLDSNSHVMTKNSDGKYVYTTELPSGSHQFKIAKNGTWVGSLGVTDEQTVLSNGVAAALVEEGVVAYIELTSATTVTFLFDPSAMTVTVSWDGAGEEPDTGEEPDDTTYRVVADFNGWNPADDSGIMTKNSDGKYTFTIEFESGSHQFRISTDGIWAGYLGAEVENTVLFSGESTELVEEGEDIWIVLASTYDVTFLFDPSAMTVTVSWDEIVNDVYTVTISDTIENGTVEADLFEAAEGDTVTLTITPDDGYEIDTVSYNDGTTDHEITATEGIYSFTMPAEHITVTATFKSTATQGSYSGGDGTKENPYILSTVEDMLAFHEAISNDDGSLDNADTCGLGMYHGYYFELGNNIDMSGVEWTPVSFCGNLDGKGFSIKNLSVTEANNGSDEYWAAMFAQLINATVSNITFENCYASISDEVSSSRDIYVAITAANAIASKLENIRVVDCFVIQNGSAKNFGYAAFVAAIADISNITGCIVKGGEISANDTSSNSVFAGGITGCFEDLYYEFIANYGNPYNMVIGAGADYGIYDCYVNADITVNAGASSHVAGITGMTMTDFLDETAEFYGKGVEIENCVYDGTLTAENSTVGGITGWDENEDHIVDCVSHATVSAAKTFPIGELPETVINSYYLSEAETEDGGKTEAQFTSGEVCTARGGHFEVDEVCVICGHNESVTTYIVKVSDTIGNGTVEADVSEAAEGDTVTLTITPDEGYILKSVSVMDTDGNDVPTTDNTFTMPASNVTVNAEFEAEGPKEITVYISTYADFPAEEYKATDGENALDYLNANYFMAQMYDMVGWELLRGGDTYYVTEDTVLSDGDTYYMIWWLGNGGSDLGIFGNCTVDMFDGISYNSYAIGSGGISGVKHKVNGVEYTFDLDAETYTIKSAFESKGIDTNKIYIADGNEVDLEINMPLAYTEFESNHSHPICGAVHTDIGDHKGECADIEWTAWDGTTELGDGYYYLTKDVDASVTVSNNVHLCLNGYSLKGTEGSVVHVMSEGQFTLTDCIGTGKITGGTGTDVWGLKIGGGIYFESYYNLRIFGGTITGNSANTEGAGIYSDGNVYLYGGSVTGNSFTNEEARTIEKTQVDAPYLYLYGGSFDTVETQTVVLGGAPEITGFLRFYSGGDLQIIDEITNTSPIPLFCNQAAYLDNITIGSEYGHYADKFKAYEEGAVIRNEEGELVYRKPVTISFYDDNYKIIYEVKLSIDGGKLPEIPEIPVKIGYAALGWMNYDTNKFDVSTETVYTKSTDYHAIYEPYETELEELPNGYRISVLNGTVKEITWHPATPVSIGITTDNAEPYTYYDYVESTTYSSSYENGKWIPASGAYFVTDLKKGDTLIAIPDDSSNIISSYLNSDNGWATTVSYDPYITYKVKRSGRFILSAYGPNSVKATTPISAKVNTYEIGEAIEGETSDIFSNGTNGEYYNVRMVLTDGTVLEEVFEYDIPVPAFFVLGINLEREYGGNPITDTESGYTSLGKLTIKDSEGKIAIEAFEDEMSQGQNPVGKTLLTAYIDGIPTGDYTIIFEKPGYCTLQQSVTVVEGSSGLTVTPVCGDIRGSLNDTVGDGKVDFDDFIRVLRGFKEGSSALFRASVDLNEDGVVSVNDLAIIKTNYGKTAE